MMFSPLETFEVILYFPFSIAGYDFSVTNGTLYLFLVSLVLLAGFRLAVFSAGLVPNSYQWVAESLYRFVLGMVKEQTHSAGLGFFPLFFFVFLFILFSNLFGLFPFAFTTTAQFAVSFALALSFNIGFILLGLSIHRVAFFKLFVPSDAPVALIPLIVLIEVVSYLIRTFSLSIRLFANMMAGHTLLHILTTFSIKLVTKGFVGPMLAALPFFIVLAVFCLELGIALIQAYVFTILLCIYLNDSYHPGH